MNNLPHWTIGLFILSIANSSHAICSSIDSLDWLQQRWVTEDENKTSVESWKKVSGLSFEGVGEAFDAKTKRVVFSESLRILEMSGEVFYLAKVKENPLPIAFKLTACPPQQAIFENRAHDFPQRIEYRLDSKGELIVKVSGDGGRSFEQVYIAQDE